MTTLLDLTLVTRVSLLFKNHPAWATGDDNDVSVHSAVNEWR